LAGTTLAQALRLATRNPARVFGVESSYGAPAADTRRSAAVPLGEEAARLEVVATVAAGRLVFREQPDVP
jgi:adenine deaminase